MFESPEAERVEAHNFLRSRVTAPRPTDPTVHTHHEEVASAQRENGRRETQRDFYQLPSP